MKPAPDVPTADRAEEFAEAARLIPDLTIGRVARWYANLGRAATVDGIARAMRAGEPSMPSMAAEWLAARIAALATGTPGPLEASVAEVREHRRREREQMLVSATERAMEEVRATPPPATADEARERLEASLELLRAAQAKTDALLARLRAKPRPQPVNAAQAIRDAAGSPASEVARMILAAVDTPPSATRVQAPRLARATRTTRTTTARRGTSGRSSRSTASSSGDDGPEPPGDEPPPAQPQRDGGGQDDRGAPLLERVERAEHRLAGIWQRYAELEVGLDGQGDLTRDLSREATWFREEVDQRLAALEAQVGRAGVACTQRLPRRVRRDR